MTTHDETIGPFLQQDEEVGCAIRSDAEILLTGDKCLGRDGVARFIHEHSRRQLRPIAFVNCAGVPEDLLYSLLFGHRQGSFADADAASAGWFERADGGTLVLEEIGDLTPRLQDALMNFLDTGAIQPLGAENATGTAVKVDVRIISASSTELHAVVLQGRFHDLYYRLNVVHIVLPNAPSEDDRLSERVKNAVVLQQGPDRRVSGSLLQSRQITSVFATGKVRVM